MDADGKYYRLTLSVGKNGVINTVYNVGKIKEEGKYSLRGSKPVTDNSVTMRSSSSNNSVPQEVPTVNNDSMQNDVKYSLVDGSTDIAPEMNNKLYGEDIKLEIDDVPIKKTPSAEIVDNNTIEVPDITVDDMEFTVLDDTNISAESTDNSNEKSNDFFDEKAVTRLSSKVIIIDYIKPIPTTEFQALQVTLL